jgi:hypothetical protein
MLCVILKEPERGCQRLKQRGFQRFGHLRSDKAHIIKKHWGFEVRKTDSSPKAHTLKKDKKGWMGRMQGDGSQAADVMPGQSKRAGRRWLGRSQENR